MARLEKVRQPRRWRRDRSRLRRERLRPPGRLALALLLIATAVGCSPPRETPRHLLVVTIDTLRADRLGAYGYGLAHTPHLDALAERGVVADDAVASAPITLPAHSSIFTGLQPPAHGVRDNGAYALGEEALTLAEVLRERGFATQAVVSALVLDRRYGLDQGFEGYDDDLWSEDSPKMFMIRDRPARRTAERAARWLKEWHASDSERPFFLWTHFFDPHQPLQPSSAMRALTPTLYDAEIADADAGVGRILATLEELGTLEETLVLVLADHGESLGEHGEKTHALFVYDATVKIPFLLAGRGVPEGVRYAGPVRQIDILPTLLSLLGHDTPRPVEGVDLAAAFVGATDPPGLAQYSESLLAERGFGMAPLHAVRRDGYKYIRAPRPELYDLERDPKELVNRFGEEPERSREMAALLERLLEESARFAVSAEHRTLDQEMEEMLQALGYMAPAADREAMAAVGGVEGLDPKDGVHLHNRLEEARHRARDGEWDEAAELLDSVLEQLPSNVSARNVLALSHLRRGRLERAEEEYLRSLEVDPEQYRVHSLLGGLALSRGDLESAERLFRQALELAPRFVEALAQLGFIEDLRGRTDAAEELYREALAVDRRSPRARLLLGDLRYGRGDFRQALEHYRAVLEVLPEHFDALVQAGLSARRLELYDQAESWLEAAGRLRPDAWLPHYNLACLHVDQERLESALTALDAALERGFASPGLLVDDEDLAPLRNRPGFSERVERAREQSRSSAVRSVS